VTPSLDDPNAAKTKGIAASVKRWIAAGIPIDGIGSQAHLKPGMGRAAASAMRLLCSSAPECAITELDIAQAPSADYVQAVDACVVIENCVGVTVWGVADSESWRKAETPLLFDGGFSPKPAYSAILSSLRAKAQAQQTVG